MGFEKREIKIGRYYKHFKGGVYLVKGIATHTETEEKMVVYQAQYDDYRLFVRPYSMFVDRVDHQKYPEVAQEYRFELIEQERG